LSYFVLAGKLRRAIRPRTAKAQDDAPLLRGPSFGGVVK